MQIPSFITRLLFPKGLPPYQSDAEKAISNSPNGRQYTNAPNAVPPVVRDPRATQTLDEFRHYMGIHNDPDLVQPDRPVPNLGLYQRIVKAEKMYKDQYKFYSTIINLALGLQIILGAALTALGAGDGPRSAVTAFGAINTVLASVLTFLKGSGLPNRMKYYHNELTKVREYIEQREREFARGVLELDLRAEVSVIEDMYDAVKRDIELNTPDAYVSTTKQTRAPPPALSRYTSNFQREANGHAHDIDDTYRVARRGLETRFSQAKLGLEARVSDTKHGFDEKTNEVRADFDGRMNSARQDAESRITQERLGLESRLSNARQGLDSRIQQSQSRIDDQINTARLATAAQVEDTRHGIESRLEDTRAGVVAQVEDTRHGMESRLKEVQAQVKDQENKMLSMAEKIAEKVLATAQQRRDQDRP